jgi:hypothetical protein
VQARVGAVGQNSPPCAARATTGRMWAQQLLRDLAVDFIDLPAVPFAAVP